MGLGAALAFATFIALAVSQSAAGADLPVDLELVLAVMFPGRSTPSTPISSAAATPVR